MDVKAAPDSLRWCVKVDISVVLGIWHIDGSQVKILKHTEGYLKHLNITLNIRRSAKWKVFNAEKLTKIKTNLLSDCLF